MCTIKADGAKILPRHQHSQVFYKLTKLLKWTLSCCSHVRNCVIGNPPQLNPCEYGWETNEGEKSLRPTVLPTRIKVPPDEILQTTRCKCVSIQCNENKCRCVRAGLNCSEFCDCQQSDYQIKMHMDDNENEDKNNDSKSGTEDD